MTSQNGEYIIVWDWFHVAEHHFLLNNLMELIGPVGNPLHEMRFNGFVWTYASNSISFNIHVECTYHAEGKQHMPWGGEAPRLGIRYRGCWYVQWIDPLHVAWQAQTVPSPRLKDESQSVAHVRQCNIPLFDISDAGNDFNSLNFIMHHTIINTVKQLRNQIILTPKH